MFHLVPKQLVDANYIFPKETKEKRNRKKLPKKRKKFLPKKEQETKSQTKRQQTNENNVDTEQRSRVISLKN